MKKLSVFIAVLLAAAAFAAEKMNTILDVKGSDILKNLTVEGYKEGVVEEQGKVYFNSRKIGQLNKFRYARLRVPQNVSGDVNFSVQYAIKNTVHYNGIEIKLTSVEKNAFQAVLRRDMTGGRKENLTAYVFIKGKKVASKNINYAEYAGTLEIKRSGNKVIFTGVDPKGARVTFFEYDNFPSGAAGLALKYTSAAQTYSCFEIISIKAECSQKISTAMYPEFLPKKKIADVEFFPVKGCKKNPDGTFTVSPGGVLAGAVMGKAHMKNCELLFSSRGKLKVCAFQAGNFEPAVTGEFLMFDEKDGTSKLQERRIFPGTYLVRNPWERRWPYPIASIVPCLVFEFYPAGKESVTIAGKAELRASILKECDVVEADAKNTVIGRDGRVSPADSGKKIVLGKMVLPFASGKDVQGKFTALDFKLDSQNPAFSIKLDGKTAGAVEVFTAAGIQTDKDAPVAAGCQILYADNSTETNFFMLRWNTGVYHEPFMKRGPADCTWWGPTGFPRGELVMLPGKHYGSNWTGVYRTIFINPQPAKPIKQITFYKMPKSGEEFLISGVNLLNGEKAVLSAIEPDDSVFTPGKKSVLRAFFYSKDHKVLPESENDIIYKRPGSSGVAGKINFIRRGDFSYGYTEIETPANSKLAPGPVRLGIAGKESVMFGVMPEKHGKFHFTMIAGSGYSRSDFERIRRIGYDTVKLMTMWDEPEMDNIFFSNSDLYLDRVKSNKLDYSIRNHIRMMKGPEWFQKKGVFQKRYEPGKDPAGAFPARPQIDPADAWTVSRFVKLYAETAKFAQKNNAISINANYGLRPEIGIKHIDMGAASLAMFRKLLESKYKVAEVNKKTGFSYKSFADFQPLDLYNDESGFLLKEYAVMHHGNLYKAQRAVVEAIRKAGYTGHLTFNVSFHPVEQKLIGANAGAYQKLANEFPPASLFHETSDRYSLSFVKWLSSKRTFNQLYGDEGCACPPNDIHNKAAFFWMTMMQCFDTITCQWFGGRPGMLEIGSLKSLHALLYDAQYLHDGFSLAIAYDSGFDEAHLTIRTGLHNRMADHYGLASTLRELNLNADRYMIDEFPDYDKNVKSLLLIDDNNRSIRPEFGKRIEKFVRNGGVYLATPATDLVNKYAFLKKLGIDPGKLKKGEVITRKLGKGKLVFRNCTWGSGSWDPGMPHEKRKEIFDLITSVGKITPLVQTSDPILFATPYRDKNGDLLIHLVNFRAASVTADVLYQAKLAGDEVYDCAAGKNLKAHANGKYKSVKVTLPEMSSTVLRVKGR